MKPHIRIVPDGRGHWVVIRASAGVKAWDFVQACQIAKNYWSAHCAGRFSNLETNYQNPVYGRQIEDIAREAVRRCR